MSARVGVLAVLDDRIAVEKAGMIHPAQLIEVRAAVAELLAADKEFDEAMDAEHANSGRGGPAPKATSDRRIASRARRAAALARCGGEA
ncbi:hypothetical protein LXM94_25505 [Rhizobium sp. TRM95111]|uniref:hypothetical protein n=1 Tax=Rhizobium alarense TaxID=2846851 RepID=UPI001F1F8A0A|nr:hypothetical protein [Rhizobium alarense]MCF3643314.1 hypothetical protein [Rhizobium alarense]